MSAGAFCPKCTGPVTAGGCNPAMDRCVRAASGESQGALWEAVRPEAVPEARRAEYDVDCTPLTVIEQTLRGVLAGWELPEVLTVLDVAAGYGAWSKVLRRLAAELGFALHITGLEVREECRPHLQRHCDAVYISDVEHWASREDYYDFIMGNPPFSLTDKRANRVSNGAGQLVTGKSRMRAFEVLVVALRERLWGPEARLALFVPTDWTGRSGPLAKLAQDHVPMFELYQAAPVGFRLNAGTDTRTYKTAVWGDPSLPAVKWTKKRTLPILELADRTLKGLHLPGTEP